ncbi:MAG: GspE/PulE family protein [Candidatus Margulisbacteria bacterium]|jgi:type IV pilus assembly protein PilB|nr:GspE/PulE family protein [Candidatus Margulisiibacteriota bacterium]
MEPTSIADQLDEIVTRGIELAASDVHLEPREEFLRVRYRVDGLLQEGVQVPKKAQLALLSRLKVMVNLDIAESRLPQDGRTTFRRHDLRVSLVPTIHGEKAVIRLLNRKHAHLTLSELGLEPDDLTTYRRLIGKKTGLLLVTGPTGSGKTTTLYTTLTELNNKEVNIITIEDPVEYQLPGVNQLQVNQKAGLTFARGLRSILRQDPDIIMVGEIRDLETARIAVQAALTGHLVLATLHTNNASSALTRLVEIGIERYLVEATVIGVVAQRLVRTLANGAWRGWTGIYELLVGTQSGPASKKLLDDGEIKIGRGLTTREEVARVLSD